MRARCEMITVHVIDKANAWRSSTIVVSPLKKCVDELEEVAERYDDQGRFVKKFGRKYDDRIQKLRARIEAVVSIMGLAVGFNNADKLLEIQVRLVLPRLITGEKYFGFHVPSTVGT